MDAALPSVAAMTLAFPGMNPYLENPDIWPEIHAWLIVQLARSLNPRLKPKYRAAVEQRVYTDPLLVGIPDVSVFSQPTGHGPNCCNQHYEQAH